MNLHLLRDAGYASRNPLQNLQQAQCLGCQILISLCGLLIKGVGHEVITHRILTTWENHCDDVDVDRPKDCCNVYSAMLEGTHRNSLWSERLPNTYKNASSAEY